MNDSDTRFLHLLLQHLKNPATQLTALKNLTDKLIYINDTILNKFPLALFAETLTTIIITNRIKENLVLATQCCMLLINVHTQALKIFYNLGLLPAIDALLKQNPETTIKENCLAIICAYALQQPQLVAKTFRLSRLLDYIPEVSIASQRKIMQSIAFICQDGVSAHPSDLLMPLYKYLTIEDQTIKQYATRAFISLVNRISPRSLPISIASQFPHLIVNASETSQALTLSSVFYNATKEPEILKYFAQNLPDFEELLTCRASFENQTVSSNILKIMQNLMPTPKLPKFLWVQRVRSPVTVVEPFKKAIVHFMIDVGTHESTSVSILAACASLQKITPDLDLITVLLRLAKTSKTAPYVMSICCNFENISDVFRSGLFNLLQNVHVHSSANDWFKEKLRFLQTRQPKNESAIPAQIQFSQEMGDVLQYINNQKFLPYQFLSTSLLDKCKNMIQAGASAGKDLSTIISLAFGVIQYYSLPTDKDPLKTSSYGSFSKKLVSFKATLPSRNSQQVIQVPILSTLLYVEAVYNLSNNKQLPSKLKAAIHEDYFLRSVLGDDHSVRYEQNPELFAIMCRQLNLSGYVLCSFHIEDILFSAYEPITYVLSRVCPNILQMKPTAFQMRIIENDYKRIEFNVERFNCPEMKKAIDLLSAIAVKRPDIKIVNKRFSMQIVSKFSSPTMTLLMAEQSIRMIFSVPSMFSFEDRCLALRSVALHPMLSAKYLRNRFDERGEPIVGDLNHLKFMCDRKRLFEQGKKLMQKLGNCQILIDVSFIGEKGFGDGPTKEYYTELSQEFCKTELNLWRSTLINDMNIYAQDSNGLFPRPDCDNQMLEILGLFISKAISHGRILDMPFNPSFWKLLQGYMVPIEDVDPEIAHSLQYKEGLYGLDFTYPGIPTLPLKAGGENIEVDQSNVQEYISLVKDFTCGQYMIRKLQHFINGFNKNIIFNALRIFTPDEINKLVCGETHSLTEDELRKYIRAEHGYDMKSPEIEMFINIIPKFDLYQQEQFIKFVTGCTHLPIGGLGGLDPPLTIAKRVTEGGQQPDDTLPSVMTCTNYFKLPQYSSKDVMYQKLLYAISECPSSFELS